MAINTKYTLGAFDVGVLSGVVDACGNKVGVGVLVGVSTSVGVDVIWGVDVAVGGLVA